ncbi:MAG: NifB/NifX family molybdenum-iron cluster-binding protein [Bacteroidota bacterium]
MKRIAVPVSGNLLSEHFGQCEAYRIFVIGEDEVSSERVEIPPQMEVSMLPGWASALGITDIIAYRVDKSIIALFTPFRINLFVGIPRETPEKLIDDYLNGRLKSDERIISEIIK